MVRVSNTILAIINFIILFIGLVAVAFGVYLSVGGRGTACEKGVRDPLLVAGAALCVVALLGLIGSCCRVNFFIIIYLILMFIVIWGLIAFAIFSILVTNETAGKLFSRVKITNFENWLQQHFVNDKNWNEIKSCLIDTKVCKSLGYDVDQKVPDFNKNLSPIQSGCCKPPTSCGFVFQNATFWVPPKTGRAMEDSDCKAWSNQQETLCYNCKSCRVGFVDSMKQGWIQLTIFNISVTLIAIIVYSIGCCARKNNKKNVYYTRYQYTGYR